MRLERWILIIPLRLRSLFRREDVDRELAEELAFHLDQRTQELVSRGLDPEEARRLAYLAMEGVTRRAAGSPVGDSIFPAETRDRPYSSVDDRAGNRGDNGGLQRRGKRTAAAAALPGTGAVGADLADLGEDVSADGLGFNGPEGPGIV